jgi:hypothetical protein
MKLDKVAAVAEIVSSIAIVVTLAYLAVQTQQNAAATLSNARQATLNAELALLLSVMEHPEIQTKRDTFLNDPGSLTAEELVRMRMSTVAFLRIREHMYLQYLAGILDEETWDSYATVIRQMLREPGSEIVLQDPGVQSGFDPRFVAVIEDLARQAGSPDSRN